MRLMSLKNIFFFNFMFEKSFVVIYFFLFNSKIVNKLNFQCYTMKKLTFFIYYKYKTDVACLNV